MKLCNLTIKWRITLLAGLVILLVIATVLTATENQAKNVSSIVKDTSTRALVNSAELRLQALGKMHAQNVERYFSTTYSFGEIMASQVIATKHRGEAHGYAPVDIRRDLVNQLKAGLSTRPDLLSVYLVLQPNTLDGADEQFKNNGSLGSNEIGRVAFYLSQSSPNQIEYLPTVESELTNSTPGPSGSPYNQWYICPHESMKACVLEPYPYTDPKTGKLSLVSSISLPIIDDGQLIGIIGMDIRLTDLQGLANDVHHELYDGIGQVTILSSQGLIAGYSKDETKLTSTIQSIDAHKGQQIFNWSSMGAMSIQELDGTKLFIYPFQPLSSSDFWSVILEVPSIAMLEPVNLLQLELVKLRKAGTGFALLIALGASTVGLLCILFTAKAVTRQISMVSDMLGNIGRGEGDLTRRIRYPRQDELGDLCQEFNNFLDKLQPTIAQISKNANDTLQLADRAAYVAVKTDGGIKRQYLELDQVATASIEMSTNATDVAQNAANAASAAVIAQEATERGLSVIQDMVGSMEEVASQMNLAMADVERLSEQSEQIGAVLSVIRSIADQTNLLALNAAIEAARAGDAGRGFAVVADEVRKLARRTRKSVDEIRQVIEKLQHGTTTVVTTIRQSQELTQTRAGSAGAAVVALTKIESSVATISEMNTQIASAAEQQSSVAEEMTRNISTVRDLSNVLSSQTSSSSEVSNNLNRLALSQQTLTNQFKV